MSFALNSITSQPLDSFLHLEVCILRRERARYLRQLPHCLSGVAHNANVIGWEEVAQIIGESDVAAVHITHVYV